MRIKVFLLTIFMLLFLTGCNLFGTPTVEPTNEPTVLETPTVEPTIPKPTPTPEPVVTSIYVKNSQKQYVDIGETYNYSKLVIMAILSDGTEIDVSDNVTFGKIDTSIKGEKKLNIKYEEFETSITITVIVPIGLEVDSSNVKKEYVLGEKLNISNIIINSLYEGGIKLSPNFYLIGMNDPNGDFLSVDTEFSVEGEYIVAISTMGFREEFVITVGDVIEPTPTPEIVKYTVTFNSNGGSAVTSTEVEQNKKVSAPTAPTKEGYTFVGWFSDETLTTAWDFENDVVTADTTLYAKWKEIIDSSNEFTVTFGYSGYSSYMEFTGVVDEDSKPEDFIRTESGYVFSGFSTKFENWKEEGFIKIYLNKLVNGKFDVILVEDDYTYVGYKTYNANSTVVRSDLDGYRPNYSPEGMKFSHWDLPESFNISETIYVKPVYVPLTFDSTNITEELTVNNVSANAIDVNVEEFLKATPEGYSLDSITIGLNGEIINEIPFEEGMKSAYFTELTNNTEYEIGAYYSQNQTTTLTFRKSRQLTYRFHFVGFMIVTKGDVMYRVRMTYQGDTLYRWYYAENTYVSNYYFFYDFTLPIEYDGYKCVGCEEFIGNITSDMDLEVVLVPPAGDTCTVVFYTEDYPYGDETILKTEVVNKGASATPPTISDSYIEGNYEYVLTGWSKSYENVTTNVYTYPIYEPKPLKVPTVKYSLIIGDTYCFYMAETDMPEIVIDSEIRILDSSNNLVWSDVVFAHPMYDSIYQCTDYGVLEKNTNYKISFYPMYDDDLILFEHEFNITTRKGTEKLGYNFDAKSETSYSYSINMNYVDVRNFVEYRKDSNGDIVGFGLMDRFNYKKHNTTYYINPITDVKDQNDSYDWQDDIMYVYFDNITVTTQNATIPTVVGVSLYVPTGELSLTGTINDPSLIVNEVVLYYKVTDNSNYIYKRIHFEKNQLINLTYQLDLSVVDPDTGITHYYEVEDAYLMIYYIYDGNRIPLKRGLGE